MSYDCPKGHRSTEADYCSECGIRITAASTLTSVPPATADTAAAPGGCPVCGAPATPGARFCEVCRFDFVANKSSDPTAVEEISAPADPAPPPTPADAPPPPPAVDAAAASVAAPASSPLAAGNLWVVVTADRSLMSGDDAGLIFPEGEPPRVYPLDLDENLVGRRSAKANVHPEIPINDPSVSGRHLKICRRRDGSAYLVDVGSSNGTKLNGQPVDAGVETALKPGDQVLIGAWTRLVVEER